ncbi:External alternative NAD(P)H-ubiquinone oxidoreductase B1, mitochondrial [Balamuthia mandrillaris]
MRSQQGRALLLGRCGGGGGGGLLSRPALRRSSPFGSSCQSSFMVRTQKRFGHTENHFAAKKWTFSSAASVATTVAIVAGSSAAAIYFAFGPSPVQASENTSAVVSSPGGEQQQPQSKKERLVILGSGWAALSLVRELDSRHYEVVVVSPRNYFLFTPLLPSVTVGTLEARSIVDPIRKYCKRNGADIRFFEAACTSINPNERKIVCEDESTVKGEMCKFELSYDWLVVAVGSQNATFGTPGVHEHCHFLKELEDAQKIRNEVMDCFETANLPGQPEQEQKRLLNFVVVGGGPTGVEFAAELHDFVTEDLKKYLPSDLMKHVRITLIQSAEQILNTYDVHLRDHAMKAFNRQGIDLHTLSRVTKVEEKAITFLDKTNNTLQTVPYGMCVWAAGIEPRPVVKDLCKQLGDGHQRNIKAIITDRHLRVKGATNIFAIGDCGTIDQKKLLPRLEEMFEKADLNKDGFVSVKELEEWVKSERNEYPQLETYVRNIKHLFEMGDLNKDGVLSKDEFKKIVTDIDKSLMPLPCTAQVASQQGKYVAQWMNANAVGKIIGPFRYRHFGSLAYIGAHDAVMELNGGFNFAGLTTWWMWRTTYLSKQVSFRNKTLVGFDWVKETLFGRDISRF